jgi:hypothetical protein
MGKRTHHEIPAELKEAEQRFAEWRSSQSGRRPIPGRGRGVSLLDFPEGCRTCEGGVMAK